MVVFTAGLPDWERGLPGGGRVPGAVCVGALLPDPLAVDQPRHHRRPRQRLLRRGQRGQITIVVYAL